MCFVAYAFLKALGAEFKWYVVAPYVRRIRKFTFKPLGDFLEAIVAESWNPEWDQWEEENLPDCEECYHIDRVCPTILLSHHLCFCFRLTCVLIWMEQDRRTASRSAWRRYSTMTSKFSKDWRHRWKTSSRGLDQITRCLTSHHWSYRSWKTHWRANSYPEPPEVTPPSNPTTSIGVETGDSSPRYQDISKGNLNRRSYFRYLTMLSLFLLPHKQLTDSSATTFWKNRQESFVIRNLARDAVDSLRRRLTRKPSEKFLGMFAHV